MDETLLLNSNPDWDSLEIYFEVEKWNELSAYEKERFSNLKKNYETLKSIGLNPKVPQFMLLRKKAERKSSVKKVNSRRASKKDISEEQGVAIIEREEKLKEDSGESIPSSLESTLESNGAQRSDYYMSNEAREKLLRKMLPPQYDNLKGKELWQKLMEIEWKPEEATVTPSTKNSLSLLFKKVQIYLDSSKEDYLRSLGLVTSNSALEKENEEVKSVIEHEGTGVDGVIAEEIEHAKSASEKEDSVDDIAVLDDEENIDVNCGTEKKGTADDITVLEEANDVNSVSRKEASADDFGVLQEPEDDENSTLEREVAKICDECEEGYEGDCPTNGPLMHMLDTPVPIGSCLDRAKRTCPAFMSVCRSSIKGAGLGVWTEWGVPKGVVFGPYEGKIVKKLKEAQQSGYAWEIRRKGRPSHYVEASDPSISNWLRFVNCAPCEQRQNLIAFQYNEQIFYRTYKLIPPAAELLVWYGDKFAANLGISLSEDSDAGHSETCHKESLLNTRNRFVRCPKLLRRGGNISTGAVYFTAETEQQQPHSRTKMRNKYFSKTKSSPQCEEPGRSTESRNACTEKKGTNEKKKNDCERNCSHCDYETSDIGNLNRHVKSVHMKLRPHKCSQSDYRASQAITLKQHLDVVHKGFKPHKCPHCDYSVLQAIILKQHVNAVHMGLKLHKCSQCDYRTSYATSLKRHVNAVHMGLKPHKCSQCDYRASQAIHLKQHVNAVHIGLKPHKCPHCDYRASESSNIKRHVNAMHMGL